MAIRVTVAPEVKRKMQLRSGQKATHQLTLYCGEALATTIDQLSQLHRRSVSAVLIEMVEFALESLDSGEAELDQAASTMHPLPLSAPLSYQNIAADQVRNRARKQTVKLRMTDAHEPTFAEIAAETVKRIPGPSDEFINERARREANARNGYGLIRE